MLFRFAYLKGNPSNVHYKIQIMEQRLANILGNPIKLPNDPHNRKILAISIFVIIFSCPFFVLFRRGTHIETGPTDNATTTPPSTTVTIVPSTKWWIKTTSTSSSTSLSISVPTKPSEESASDCSSVFSSHLQPGNYGYISLIPPLPNRVRVSAGKANAYLGQIQPGASVKLVDGPLCVDGFSWWLVEAVEGGMRGWTVTGSKSEQWVLPCPNPTVVCKMTPVSTPSSPTTAPLSTPNDNQGTCISEVLSIGMLTQVEQENLLVIRSEPYIGSVLGHAGPLSAVTIVDGPACVGDTIWWKVNVASLNLSGWTAEANLRACSKENGCT